MKILHCIDSINPAFGGPVEAVRQFALASLNSRHAVEVVTLDDDASQRQPSWPVRVHYVPGSKTAYSYNPRFVDWLRDNRLKYDAVVAHGLWKFHTVGVWQALRGTETPYFVIPHGMLNPWLKRTYPLKHLKKSLFWYTLVNRSLREAAAVLFLCEDEPTLAQKTFNLNRCVREIVPLGISASSRSEIPSGQFLDRFPHLHGKRVMLFLGRICLMKGCDLLLKAFARTAQIDTDQTLVIAGPDEDEWQSELVSLAKSLGIGNRVVWTGPLYGDLKHGALGVADSFILPSHCETFPVAVLEALSHGKPVLITDKVNIWREIDNDGAGLVSTDTEDGVTDLLTRWYLLSDADKTSCRLNAARCFQSRFEIGAAFKAHVNVYQKYLGANVHASANDLVGQRQA